MSWIKFKIYCKLHFVYPYSDKFRKVKSIIPADVQIGDGVVIEPDVEFSSPCAIEKNCFIGTGTRIYNCAVIGSFTSISSGVKVGLISHPMSFVSTSPVFYSKKRGWVTDNACPVPKDQPVEIGHDVLISMNALLMPGIKIGDGAVIGAGAFVNRDVPPFAVVGGVPAKIIKYRFDESVRDEILKSKWWDYSDEKLKTLTHLSNDPERFMRELKKK